MKLETPLIASLIAGMFFIGVFTMFGTLAQPYISAGLLNDTETFGLEVNNGTESVIASLDKLDESKDAADEVTATFDSLTPSFTSLFPFLKTVWGAGKLLIDSVLIPRDIFIAVAQIVGIPTSIVYTLFTILLLVIVVTLVIILAGRVI